MSDKTKYIVISISPLGGRRVFNTILASDYDTIITYVEKLTFNENISLLFYGQDRVDHIGQYAPFDEILTMNNTKSLAEFRDEVDELLRKLDMDPEAEK